LFKIIPVKKTGKIQTKCVIAGFRYQTNLANVAVSTLQQVMQDQNAPAVARVSAARTALELAGDLGTNSGNGTEQGSLCEMTPGELSRLIERWEDERVSITKDITPV